MASPFFNVDSKSYKMYKMYSMFCCGRDKKKFLKGVEFYASNKWSIGPKQSHAIIN